MRRPPAERRDVAAEITNLIIAKIEAGTAPWARSWSAGSGGSRPLRYNGQAYSGINCLYLWAVGAEAGYASPYWMTYNQAAAFGAQVRCGERGTLSVYFNAVNKTETDASTGEECARLIRFMRHYVVFNAEQIDGLAPHFHPAMEGTTVIQPSTRQAAIDAFFAAIPADIRHGGDKAFFSPSQDYIQVPRPSAFKSQDHFASTLAHECCHWSGHPDRLARTFGKRFGDDAYAFEEIVATIGQSFICADLDLPPELHDSHASYVDHWLRVLKADKTAIIHASSKAEQAVRFLNAFGDG